MENIKKLFSFSNLFIKKNNVKNVNYSNFDGIKFKNDIDYYATFFVLFVTILIVLFITTMSWYIAYRNADSNKRCSGKQVEQRKMNVTAYNKDDGKPLYSVKYDLNRKKFNSECLCVEGDTANNFRFPAMKLSTGEVQDITKTCKCDGDYTNKDEIYYKGESALIDFMENKGNTYAFLNI